MPIFAVMPRGNSGEALANAIAESFADRNLPLGANVWLVASPLGAKDVSDQLGITDGSRVPSALVLQVANYFGRADPNTWTWIKSNWEATAGD